jgi:predicted RNase H-like nuclease
MSTYNEHFTGGKLKFITPEFSLFQEGSDGAEGSEALAIPTAEDIELTVEPRAGRVAIFTAGHENTHFVERVQSGQRFVLSFWFTCDARREFEIFLDGKAHTTFSHKVRESNRKRAEAARRKEL